MYISVIYVLLCNDKIAKINNVKSFNVEITKNTNTKITHLRYVLLRI